MIACVKGQTMHDVYLSAADVIHKFSMRRGGLKSLTLSNPQLQQKKAVYLLSLNTLIRYESLTMAIADASDLPSQDTIEFFLLLVLLYEGLYGNGISNEKRRKRRLSSTTRSVYKQALILIDSAKELAPTKPLEAEAALQHSLDVAQAFPRALRVNRVTTTVKQVLGRYKGSVPDPVLPDVVVLSKSKRLETHKDAWIAEGKATPQSRASCLPVSALFDYLDGHTDCLGSILDFCSAPGNKTAHAAIRLALATKGYKKQTQYAVVLNEIDATRAKLAEKLTKPVVDTLPKRIAFTVNTASCFDLTEESVGASCHPPTICIVDPSCSSSGVVGNIDQALGKHFSEPCDIEALSEFQFKCLSHALDVPSVCVVVYSTCSIHDAENETVVRRALEGREDWAVVPVLSKWVTRGHGDDDVARCSIRADPAVDHTDGFFTAVLVKKRE